MFIRYRMTRCLLEAIAFLGIVPTDLVKVTKLGLQNISQSW